MENDPDNSSKRGNGFFSTNYLFLFTIVEVSCFYLDEEQMTTEFCSH